MKNLGVWHLVLVVFIATYAVAAGAADFQITTTVFKPESTIPSKYTCDGLDISPPLRWTDPPRGTKSLALIMDDLDATLGSWVHWVVYNIPATVSSLPAAVPSESKLADGTLHGKNSWYRIGYGGPCPRSGRHRYLFKLYALDAMLDLAPGATKGELLKAMKGHILAESEIMGKFR